MLPDRRPETYEHVKLSGLPELAKTLLQIDPDKKVWLFYGDMGAGKTTFIKAICEAMDVRELVNSPTFSIINEYKAGTGKVFHFDFYRIKNEAEAYEIGTEEYFYSGEYCFIEWPEKIPSLIPSAHVKISIQTEDNEHRTIAISIHDGEEENRV